MLAASFMNFVSSSNVTVLVLLARSNKVAVLSQAEERPGDELTFFGGLHLPLCEDIFADDQRLFKPGENRKKI